MSVISSACSPVSGWETSSSSMFDTQLLRVAGSRACSASTKAAVPPCFWASATTCKLRVVLPEDSGRRSPPPGPWVRRRSPRPHPAPGSRWRSLPRCARPRLTHAHHRALAELLLDLAQRGCQGLLAIVVHLISRPPPLLKGSRGAPAARFEISKPDGGPAKPSTTNRVLSHRRASAS